MSVAFTLRLKPDMARKLRVTSQALGISINKLVESSIAETLMFYEGDEEFKAKHKKWLANQKL